ncbi:hypothetical protein QYF61_007208, partial [Mycteria americana]
MNSLYPFYRGGERSWVGVRQPAKVNTPHKPFSTSCPQYAGSPDDSYGLDEWPLSEFGGWLEWIQGSALGAVLVKLVSNPDDGMENTFTEFVGDAKLCRETEVLEGRVAIQQDHSKLQEWARGSSMNFTKKIGKTSLMYHQRLGLTGQGAALLARIL